MVKIGDRMVVAVKHTAIMYDRYCHRMSMRSDDEEVGSMGQRRWYSSNNNSISNNNNDDKSDRSDKTRNGDKSNSISIKFIKNLFKNDILDHKIYQYLDTNLENMKGVHIANFMSAASNAKCKLPGRYISKIATAIRSSKVKMDMIEMSMLLYSLRMYKHEDEFMMDLIAAITDKIKKGGHLE